MAQRSQESLLRIMPISLSTAELAEMEDAIEAGILPKDHIDNYFDAVEKNVFGDDHKKDRQGNPIEQGLGSPGNQTAQSVEAYKRWHKGDSDYAETVKKLEAQLSETNERRKAEAAAANKGRKRRFSV